MCNYLSGRYNKELAIIPIINNKINPMPMYTTDALNEADVLIAYLNQWYISIPLYTIKNANDANNIINNIWAFIFL